MANTIACSIVFSRWDYCNAFLYVVNDLKLNRLQRAQNSLDRIAFVAPYHSPATFLRCSLHWLPIRRRIEYKVVSLTFKIRLHHQPIYLSELAVNHVPARSLRSADKILLVVPQTKSTTASRSFSVAVPRTWNSLSLDIRTSISLRAYHASAAQDIFARMCLSLSGSQQRLCRGAWKISDIWKGFNLGRSLTVNLYGICICMGR